ncbi:acid sphingomyelinase-like phosphodiesterase 3b [Dreissena polymorpha]|uniref:Sphingomyelinase phosphodiesterase n=1 Tax=Dreissena polymorpha TaxID=45954 RepID=A0A9D4EX16_DREPO|nr:acid sphingomyelinase-like phosphodiesterase 3b [Dreissena polymorpha]KAH3787782.1 hypothetical protein DPMN_165911 [Dreissena polymorpha]
MDSSPILVMTAILTIASSDSGFFWHITDFHYDFTYHDRQLSCNPNAKPTHPGQFGDFWCDSPWKLVNSSVHAMAKLKQNADFILWTGDTVLHASDSDLNYDVNAAIHKNTTDLIKSVLPGVHVYASFGNHDYWPNNQFPPANNRLYNDTLERWGPWINDSSQDNYFRKGAYYTVKTPQGLRIISLNTNLYYTSDKETVNVSDPADQLQWLNATLVNAKTSNEKVLITAHISPGVHTPSSILWMHEKFHTPLVDILQTHADIIVGMFFGHDHSDGFKVLPDKTGTSMAPIFIAPSVTPWRYVIPNEIGPAHNPGIRLVEYDRTTGRPLDITQYYLDLKTANQNATDNWEVEYEAKKDYEIPDLTAATLAKLASKIKDPGSKEFKNYWRFYTVSAPTEMLEACVNDCHSAVYCGLTFFDMDSFRACQNKMISGSSQLFSVGRMMTTFVTSGLLIAIAL